MKRKRIQAAFLAACFLLGMGGTYAYHQSSIETINKVATGDVNIGITEYEEKERGEKKYEGPENGIVLPSQVISKIPRITNYAEACYVRVKPVFSEFEKTTEEKKETEKTEETERNEEKEGTEEIEETEVRYQLCEADLGGMNEAWKKAGEYYYYPKILKKKDSVDFFRTVTIPAAWSSAVSGQVLEIALQAEAVQAANFTPDFTSDAPWGDLEAEQCVHETDNVVSEVSQRSLFCVTYEGAARNLILAPDNFFRNSPVLMPGDERKDVFTLTNTTDSSAEFFFRTEIPETLSEQEKELLQKVELEIMQGDTVLYRGDLQSKSLQERKSLGILESGERKEIGFSLRLPSDLNNEWALRESKVKWIFSVEGEELPEEEGPSIWHSAPKTGVKNPTDIVPAGILTAGVILYLRTEKKKRRKK